MSAPSSLPGRIDPHRLAASDGLIEGEVSLAQLPRLAGVTLLGPRRETARLSLRFSQDGQRRVVMTGSLRARLQLRCQRCLEPVDWAVDAAVHLVAVADEEAAAQVPRESDPVLVSAEGLDLHALVEDELILALPIVARCENARCSQQQTNTGGGGASNNPFAALAGWRDRNKPGPRQ